MLPDRARCAGQGLAGLTGWLAASLGGELAYWRGLAGLTGRLRHWAENWLTGELADKWARWQGGCRKMWQGLSTGGGAHRSPV